MSLSLAPFCQPASFLFFLSLCLDEPTNVNSHTVTLSVLLFLFTFILAKGDWFSLSSSSFYQCSFFALVSFPFLVSLPLLIFLPSFISLSLPSLSLSLA